jgi:hypothetical protein
VVFHRCDFFVEPVVKSPDGSFRKAFIFPFTGGVAKNPCMVQLPSGCNKSGQQSNIVVILAQLLYHYAKTQFE